MSFVTIAEIYNINGSLNIGDKLTMNLWSNLLEQYCKVLITCLGSKNVFTSKEESLIVIGNNNIFYRIETEFTSKVTSESHDWGDWRSQPTEVITNKNAMNYVKYNIPTTVYLALVGVISGRA